MHDDRPSGRIGTRCAPDLVDKVLAADGEELDALSPQALAQILDHGLGVQPGIETHDITRFQALAEPVLKFGLGGLEHLKGAPVDLSRRLYDVAPVNEQRSCAARYHGEPSRSRKAREPFEPLGRGWHVLALVFVGARHEKRVKTGSYQPLAQLLHAPCAGLARFGRIVGLEHALPS